MVWIYNKEDSFWSHIDLGLKSRSSSFQLCDLEKFTSLSLQSSLQWSLVLYTFYILVFMPSCPFHDGYCSLWPTEYGRSHGMELSRLGYKRMQLWSWVLASFLDHSFGREQSVLWGHSAACGKLVWWRMDVPTTLWVSLEHVSAPIKPWDGRCPGWQLVCNIMRDGELEPPSSMAPKFLTTETICCFKLLCFRGNLLASNAFCVLYCIDA